MLEPEQIQQLKSDAKYVSVDSTQEFLLRCFKTYASRPCLGSRAPSESSFSFLTYSQVGEQCLEYVYMWRSNHPRSLSSP